MKKNQHLVKKSVLFDDISALTDIFHFPCPNDHPRRSPQSRPPGSDTGSTPGQTQLSFPSEGKSRSTPSSSSSFHPWIQGAPLEQMQDLSLEQVSYSPLDLLQDPPMVPLLSPFSGQIDLQSAEQFRVKDC